MKEFFLNEYQEAQKNTDIAVTAITTATVTDVTATNTTVVASTSRDPKTAYAASSEQKYRIFQRGIPACDWMEVTKEEYIAYWNGVDAFRMAQVRDNACGCPKSKIRYCDCDCLMCPYYKWERGDSLDAPIVDDEGNEDTLMDRLEDMNTQTPEEALLEKAELEQLYQAIEELCEEDRTLMIMTLKGRDWKQIAKVLGLKRQSNVAKRKQRAMKALRQIMKCGV